tara:strand:- start:223 stop:654 length:432 start_codon:yes stop_codon:yes gene_type:complete
MEFNIREIEINDYYKKYFDLLSQLTSADNVDFKDWEKRIQEIKQNPYHHIFVIEDKGKIIGSATLLIEMKIIRKLSKIGHVEDVVISNKYRGKGLARELINHCINFSKNKDCYKLILNCNKDLANFYSKFGFENKNIQMSIYF